MGILDWLKGGKSDGPATFTLRWDEWEGNDEIRGAGYEIYTAKGEHIDYRDNRPDKEIDDVGAFTVRVAGVSHRVKDLQDDVFAPGRQLRLIPDPTNEHDPSAVGIWDMAGRLQAGFIPAEQSPTISAALQANPQMKALCLYEFRKAGRRGARCALRVLVAPTLDIWRIR